MGRWSETMGWTTLINTSKRDHSYGKIRETMGKKNGIWEDTGETWGKCWETR